MSEQDNVRNKILYADDDAKSRILVRKILENEGFVVSEAEDGAEAVEKASSEHPDLVIMDIQMPVMDGFDAMRQLKKIPELEQIPAIALTARGTEEDRKNILEAGYQGYLAKPIQRLLLIEEVERLLSPKKLWTSVPEEEAPPVQDDVLRGKRVLLVDDNPVNLQMGEKVLLNSGMAVLKALDGKDALEKLASGEPIDIILSDILMPGMDGYQFCRMVKTTGSYLNTPFLFYTSTYVDNKDISFGLDLGAERYIIRPVSAKSLVEILSEVLNEKQDGTRKESSAPRDALIVDDAIYYREYNERLISKLEHKLLEISDAYKTLEMRNQELQNVTQTLEEKVKERTSKLEESNRYFREMDRKKTEFLNIVAHDLRTPLTSIRSYAELLLKYKDEPASTQEEFLKIILSESARLGNLINDYLDLTRIESGLYHFKKTSVDLSGRIKHALNLLQSRTVAKEIAVEVHLDPGLKEIEGDQDKLDQVLINLFSNAVKFCHQGGKIEVRSALVSPGEAHNFPCTKAPPVVEVLSAAVMIRDNGPGIPEVYQEKIFEKFSQVDTPYVKASGGSGLGLSIVKGIMDHHRGTIWVESREGEGSAFFLILPVCQDPV